MVVDKLIEGIIKKKNPSCVGIDSDYDKIPDCYKKEGLSKVQVIYNWVIDVIDAVKDIVAVVKPQIAFYEMYGNAGIKVFEDIIKYAHDNNLVVVDDAKRNDIGNTAKAYAYAHLNNNGPINADFLTVSPFLGSDSIEPFIEEVRLNGKGIFVLVKTSNPSSTQISEAINNNDTVMNILAKFVNEKGINIVGENGYSPIGAVVGATFPDEAKQLRQIMHNNIFLVPGYGAQGGSAKDIINCFNDDGLGAIVSSSRGIIYSYLKINQACSIEEYKSIVRKSSIKMQEDIYAALRSYFKEMIY
ncbi:MAG: orotidine-5'-phosphate decarboxylase [Anaeroplasma sp.]